MKLTIRADLSENRDNTGALKLIDDKGVVLAGPFPVYGRSDSETARKKGNPTRNSLQRYGDTPTGEYRVTETFDTGDGTGYSIRSYGAHAALRLDGVAGDALLAKTLGGRTGLLIHGGALGAGNRLRATHGCLRLSDENMKKLLDAIQSAGDDPSQRMCRVLQLSATIGPPGDTSAGSDVGDPPLPDQTVVHPRP